MEGREVGVVVVECKSAHVARAICLEIMSSRGCLRA